MLNPDNRKIFRQPLTVITVARAFYRLNDGDCFTLPLVVGFGAIWVGFPVYLKISESAAIDLGSGLRQEFESWADVLLVRYGDIEKPKDG